MKKYFVSYASGATGYGWEREYDRFKDDNYTEFFSRDEEVNF